MIRSLFIGVAILAASGVALAAPVKMDGVKIGEALTGKTVAGNQKGREWQQDFQAGGGTTYHETNGRPSSPSQGRWRVGGDQYCSVWPPSEFWACHDMARDGDEIIFIESDGTEWRAKFVDE